MIKDDKKNNANPIQVADRIFLVIETLAEQGEMGLLDISRELNLNKTTVHRILNSLIYMGYVTQDDNSSKYRLNYKFCNIANKILNHIDILDIVKPYLRELVNISGETVHLVQLDGNFVVYIDKIESHLNSVRLVSSLGAKLPLY